MRRGDVPEDSVMTAPAKFWRITMKMVIKRGSFESEFTRHSTAVPGTKAQAVRHLRKVYAGMWPSAKIRLMYAEPDRQAEKKEAANASA